MSPCPPSDAAESLAPAALDNAEASSRHPRPGSYPPISTIPSTPPERLALAAEASGAGSDASAPKTVLYLAYGSNMAASTFLGMRGIRPLSRINVSVSSLRLMFDLRGAPYWEPCFANVGFRDLAKKPASNGRQAEDEWDGRLMGVVYEVTLKDWRKIMQTEGAGSSYKEIVVSCMPIRNEHLAVEKPFLARTLYAAHSPGSDGSRACNWWSRMTAMTHRPGSAQASARYLKLLSDGARENNLPDCYQRYLGSLQPYTITHWQQRVGEYVFLCTWGPLLITFLKTTSLLADDTGRLPARLAAGLNLLFNLMWMSYDTIFKPVFGDGERTGSDGSDGSDGRDGSGSEKLSLMSNGKGR
ncbi:AIG2-like family protein [Hirsutella rhossiliensis]|uniref:gamma-glutamylcyclotransferase n=1 Tax=Hirsutella rhossiliensis TaxID=111463 RepID=A0A9P8SI43_9HYPO|nr:AIG2-like family domain-containing protein [Hirsutella rhossiliensis]KAH0962809.1 AIG2-like family domain-containing protein [Hirsutella rhossiliensis]